MTTTLGTTKSSTTSLFALKQTKFALMKRRRGITKSSASYFFVLVYFAMASSFIAGLFVMHNLSNGAAVSSLSSIYITQTQQDKVDTDAEKAAADASSPASSPGISAGASESTNSMTNSEDDTLSSYDSNVAHQLFLDTAHSVQPLTDKVTVHRYERMYGQFLLPFYKKKPNMKFFEIGLGCPTHFGIGASAQLWKKLFPEAEIWEGERNASCVEEVKTNTPMLLDGINVLTGDQGNVTVLDRWIEESGGGEFDVIIDDGGHQNCQILTTFEKFWPLLRPGGLYFIEGVSRYRWK